MQKKTGLEAGFILVVSWVRVGYRPEGGLR